MKRPKLPPKYKSVSIPNHLYETVRFFVRNSPQYVSVSEFVKEAIREKIKRSLDIDKSIRENLK